jgi:hypothetical protein
MYDSGTVWFRNFLDGPAAKKKRTSKLSYRQARLDVAKMRQLKLPESILFYGGSGPCYLPKLVCEPNFRRQTAAHNRIKSESMSGGRRVNSILISS